MALIDDESNGMSNKQIQLDTKEHSIEPPCEIWIGDYVYFTKESKNNCISKFSIGYWDSNLDKYLIGQEKSPTFKVIKKFKHDKHEIYPWWSFFIVDGEEIVLPDDALILINKKPNYTPKKKRILESLTDIESNYPVFIINNNEEFKKIQEKLFSIDIVWNTDERIVFTENVNEFPLHIFIDKNDKRFFYRCKDRLYHDSVRATIIDNYDPENHNDITDRVYKMFEFDRVFKLRPNYNPKKRVLENLLLEEENKFSPFRIWCDTFEKAIECESFLHKNKYYYQYDPKKNLLRDGDWDFTCFTFTNLNLHNKTFDGYDMRRDELKTTELIFPEDKTKIKNVLKFGKIAPLYKPKKKKLNEAKNSIDDAKEIMILIRNEDELTLLYNNIKPLGYVISDGFFDIFKHINTPISLFINLHNGNISQATLDNNQRKRIQDVYYLNGVWERELTIEDLPYILRILKTGRIIEEKPNYKPKKIYKLDEDVNYEIIKNIPEYSPILTPKEQRELFKLDDKVIIRPDAFDYFNDADVQFMKFDLGQEVIITQINTLQDLYTTRPNGSYRTILNTSVVNSDDLLITVKSPRHSFTYYWYYRCLHIPIIKPNYAPRKRVLEKLNEEIVGELTDSIRHSNYFSKYTSFFVVFNSDISHEEYAKIRTLLTSALNVDTPSHSALYRNEKQFYLVFRFNKYSDCIECGWNNISALENSNKINDDVYPKLFTINDINSETKIKNILKNGGAIPDYSPRKINRFDEF